MSTIHANGAHFYYELHGTGQPLILISGYSGDHQNWLPVLAQLSKHYQVLIFDNRAIGRTQDDGRVLSAELMADDVMALAATLGLKKPHIVGHSMGGTIAQRIAIRHPDKISKLAIVTSTAKWRQAMLMMLEVPLKMRERNTELPLIAESILSVVAGEKFLRQPRVVEAFAEMLMSNPYPQSLVDQQRQFRVLREFDGIADLKHITAPTLVINGQEDVISMLYESEEMVQKIPHAQLAVLPGGHMVTLEAAAEFTKTLQAFLQGL